MGLRDLFSGTKASKSDSEYFGQQKLLAEQGDAEAQLHVASAYAYGVGIKKNEAEAARWYARAERNGNKQAELLGLALIGRSPHLYPVWREVIAEPNEYLTPKMRPK